MRLPGTIHRWSRKGQLTPCGRQWRGCFRRAPCCGRHGNGPDDRRVEPTLRTLGRSPRWHGGLHLPHVGRSRPQIMYRGRQCRPALARLRTARGQCRGRERRLRNRSPGRASRLGSGSRTVVGNWRAAGAQRIGTPLACKLAIRRDDRARRAFPVFVAVEFEIERKGRALRPGWVRHGLEQRAQLQSGKGLRKKFLQLHPVGDRKRRNPFDQPAHIVVDALVDPPFDLQRRSEDIGQGGEVLGHPLGPGEQHDVELSRYRGTLAGYRRRHGLEYRRRPCRRGLIRTLSGCRRGLIC